MYTTAAKIVIILADCTITIGIQSLFLHFFHINVHAGMFTGYLQVQRDLRFRLCLF